MINYFNMKLERLFLSAIVNVEGILKDVYSDTEFGSGVFSDKSHENLFKALIRFFGKNGVVPDAEVLKSFISNYIDESNKIFNKQQQLEKYAVIIDKIYERKLIFAEIKQLPSVRAELLKLKKGRELQKTIDRVYDYLEENEVDRAENTINNFRVDCLSEADVSDSGFYLDSFQDRLKIINDKKENPEKFSAIKTGIIGWNPDNPFDNHDPISLDLFLDGGLNKGELILVVGDSGAGKSFELMEITYNALKQKKNVAYFTIEMSRWKAETRFDSRVTGIPFRDFKTANIDKKEINEWKNKLERFEKNNGKLYITGFPRGCTVDSIEAKLKEIQDVKDVKVDLLVVDYLNDIKPVDRFGNKSSKDWDVQGEISWSLKQLSLIYDMPVVTANQGKSASGLSKFKNQSNGLVFFKRMKWSDTAFSPLPSQHATIIIGLLHSKFEDNQYSNMINHQIVKNRDGETTIGVLTFPNLKVCRINSFTQFNNARIKFDSRKNDIEDLDDES